MATISFRLAEDGSTVEAVVHDFLLPLPGEEELRELFAACEFAACRLLKEQIPRLLAALPKAPKDTTAVEAAPAPAQPLVFPIAQRLDAQLEVKVDKDLMTARCHLTTAQGGSNPEQQQILEQLLQAVIARMPKEYEGQVDLNAIKGLRRDDIARLQAESLSAEPGTTFDRVLAEGRPAAPGIPTHFEELVTPLQDRVPVPQEREDGSVDLRNLGDIETVNAGDRLVRRTPSRPGANGYNLIGQVLPSVAPENLALIAGEGAAISTDNPDLLLATRFGVPLRIDQGMLVSEVLFLDRVDLSVGNITFDGTIIINGDVGAKMEVRASKDVVVKGYAESCRIEAGGDITVHGGVIGHTEQRGKEQVDLDRLSVQLVAGQDIHIRYAQAAHLVAKRNIHAVSQLMHCHAVAGESVIVGEAGPKKSKGGGKTQAIRGGRIHAIRVAAGELGSPSNVRVIIDFSDRIMALKHEQHALLAAKEEKEIFREKINQVLRQLHSRKNTPEIEVQCQRLTHTLEHVEDELKKIEESDTALTAAIDEVRERIGADVYERLYPGIEFIICNERYRTRNEVPACSVHFRNRQMVYDRPDGVSVVD